MRQNVQDMIDAFNNTSTPIQAVDKGDGRLTKRELFAAMAASGMSAHFPELSGRSHAHFIAQQAVEIADALIEALDRIEVVEL